jgi:hypothetical protein
MRAFSTYDSRLQRRDILMLYMVEMELPDRSRIADWHDWYVNHIRKLLTVDGYFASQRFEALTPRAAPFLAIHDVIGPQLFDGSGYRSVGGPSGTGEWQKVMTNWSRNLFDGCESMPEVKPNETLALVDDAAKLPPAYRDRATWLTSIGLDQDIPKRGFLVLAADEDASELQAAGAEMFKPITEKMRKASGLDSGRQ